MHSGERNNDGLLTRREFHRIGLAGASTLLFAPSVWAGPSAAAPFVHPGILHTAGDLARMRDAVRLKQLPIFAGFQMLRAHPCSQLNYTPHTFGTEIGRNPSVNFPAFDLDANAAYQCSLMAAITGDRRYAALARTIVLGWSGSLQRVSGADAILMAGLGPFKLINAAEILRWLGELSHGEAADCAAMLQSAILPTILDFAPFANGNWDTAAIKTMLGIAVFCDDRQLFERALLYYLHGDGDGQLAHYIHENGQCQESGRDQQHTQLGLAHMGDACEIAWNQGLDLYAALQNHLLRGFEYTAAYNLGDTVIFNPDVDRTGKYRHQVISASGRGRFRPVYEQIYAHYHSRCGISMPAVERVIAQIRPEGAAPGADHTGFGTLLYAGRTEAVDKTPQTVTPAALHAHAHKDAIEITWLPPRATGNVTIERATSNAPYRAVTQNVMSDSFVDRAVTCGNVYSYRVSAQSRKPSPLRSDSVCIMAGLPDGWEQVALGNIDAPQSAQFNGKVLTLCAGGTQFMTPVDEGLFVSVGAGCHALTARFVPQTASQFVRFGLACRASSRANAPCIALLIAPAAGYVERHGWQILLTIRDENGAIKPIFAQTLGKPMVDYGRLMQPVWLRLDHAHAQIKAQFSIDGEQWTDAGMVIAPHAGLMGMVASSGIAGVNSNVRFDSIKIATAIKDKG